MQVSIKEGLAEYNIPMIGIIHVGINTGQEIPEYLTMGNRILGIDATQEHITMLKRMYPALKFEYAAVADYDGEIELNVATNNGESSSILLPKIHNDVYTWIKFEEKRMVPCRTLSSIVENPELYNVMCMDIQGAEMLALKGYKKNLNFLDMIVTEYSLVELYEGCVLKKDLDEYLEMYGFTCVAANLEHATWGDAMYVKKKHVRD